MSEGPRTPTPSRPVLPTGPSRARPACPPACHAAPLHAPARPSTPLHARPHARAQLMTSITSSRVKSDPLDETRPMSDGRSTRPATHLRCIPVASHTARGRALASASRLVPKYLERGAKVVASPPQLFASLAACTPRWHRFLRSAAPRRRRGTRSVPSRNTSQARRSSHAPFITCPIDPASPGASSPGVTHAAARE